jgi:hypothetical protein
VLQLFDYAKSVFLAVKANLCWLNKGTGVHLVQVSLLLIGHPPNERLNFFEEMRLKAVLESKFCLVGVEEGLQKNMQIRGTSTLLIFFSAFIL